MPWTEVDVDELAEALAAGARVVDVREPDEYTDGHIPGAMHVPLATVPGRHDAFRTDGAAPTYVVCKSGGRSQRACEHLAAAGLPVANVVGGTMAWMLSGRPLVEGERPA